MIFSHYTPGPGSLILPASLYSLSSLPPSFPSSQLLSSISTYRSNILSIPSTLPLFFFYDLLYFSDCLVLLYIVCLDTSWSMAGPRENLAKAVVLECTKQGDFNKLNDFLTDWLANWLFHLLTHSLADLLTDSFTDSLTHSLPDLLIHSLTHCLYDWLTWWPTVSPTHSLAIWDDSSRQCDL